MKGRGYYNSVPKNIWGRRDFIRVGSLGFLGLGLRDYLFLNAQTAPQDPANACIMIVLDGGPSHHDTFDMKPEARSDIRGSFNPIPTNVSGIRVCEYLPLTAKQADKYAIIRSVWGRTALHHQGMYFLMTGYMPSQSVDFPSLGALVSNELGSRNGMPPYILSSRIDHAMGPGFLGGAHSPFWVRQDPTEPSFQVPDLNLRVDMNWNDISDRKWLMNQLDAAFKQRDTNGQFEARDKFFQEAENILRSPSVKKAFDIGEEPEALRNRYGRTAMGQGCLLARRLVEGGVRFVTVNAARAVWDNHAQNFKRLKEVLLPEFDPAFATLIEDLHQRGLLPSTLVVVAGEFGRTPTINKNAGRDHWPKVFSVVMAGAGIKGGQVYGSSDATGSEPKDNAVSVEDLGATILDRLGIDPRKEYHSPNGRLFRLSNGGNPIRSPLV